MAISNNLYKYFLGAGVLGGVSAMSYLGIYKLRHELKTRNVPIKTDFDAMENPDCPLSDNLDRMVKRQEEKALRIKKDTHISFSV